MARVVFHSSGRLVGAVVEVICQNGEKVCKVYNLLDA